jgi:hypothetical protein
MDGQRTTQSVDSISRNAEQPTGADQSLARDKPTNGCHHRRGRRYQTKLIQGHAYY